MREDCQLFRNLGFVEDFLAERMASLSLTAFQSNHSLMMEKNLPSFSTTNWLETPNARAFATNFFITEGGFRNAPHIDNDDSRYSFCWWSLINFITGECPITLYVHLGMFK